MRKDLHEMNRLSWNEATPAQNSHRGDQVSYFRQGGNALYPEELELLGDICARSIVHLQCNAGQDTLSLANMGAQVTGVDISDTAIAVAKTIAAEANIPAIFYRMDIYDWFGQAVKEEQFYDLVFCSYGTVSWLSDLTAWARGVAAVLQPGGRFLIVDYHPTALILNESQQHVFSYGMRGTETKVVTWESGVNDFVAQTGTGLPDLPYVEGRSDFQNHQPAYEFYWGLGQIVTALLEAGLILTTLQEYPYANGYKPFDKMSQDGRRWYLFEEQPLLPLMYAISACKPK